MMCLRAVYEKPTTNIFNHKRLNTFPQHQEQGKAIGSTISIQHCTGSPPSTIRQEGWGHADESKK